MNRNLHKRLRNKQNVATFNDKLSQELTEVIELLTHSGSKTLNLEEFQKVKNICKRSDKYVKEAYSLLIGHLEEKHAEVRLSAFQLCDELFRRSHCFRDQVVLNLEQVFKLTTGKDLPPPHSVARELKRVSLRIIHGWNAEFGKQYLKLALGYDHLRQVEQVDFNTLNIVDAATQARQQENQRRLEAINRERIKKVLSQIKEKEGDITSAAKSLSNSINLLLPHPDDFFIADENDGLDSEKQELPKTRPQKYRNNSSDSEDDCQDVGLREVGMVNVTHSIQLDFIPSSEASITETPENTAIIECVRENARLISNKYLPSVKAWLEVLSKSSGHEDIKKNLVELRGELEDLLFKYSHMTFNSADDVSSDSELEEVPNLVVKPAQPPQTVDQTLWSIFSEENVASGSSSSACIKKEVPDDPQTSTSDQSEKATGVPDRKQKLLAVAPKLPFDIDLYHWEDAELPTPTMVSNSTEGHRFWVGSDSCLEELPVPEGSAALRTRVIEFSGSFKPVTHCCRVRLPSGKLCPRRDRQKCPFHGEIVPRDDTGKCIHTKDEIRLQVLAEKRQQEKPDWQDPKLLAEIKKATGMDLKMPEKGKRKKRKREYPGLTDLKKSENTVTKRLENKIFKKSVMRKVASAMDRIDQRKFRDKFGDQFQYFHST